LLVFSSCTLREPHGIFQVAKGWKGIHLYQFCLRAEYLGLWETSASSPNVMLAALRLRRGARFTYEAFNEFQDSEATPMIAAECWHG
jgi:hypothetical protein